VADERAERQRRSLASTRWKRLSTRAEVWRPGVAERRSVADVPYGLHGAGRCVVAVDGRLMAATGKFVLATDRMFISAVGKARDLAPPKQTANDYEEQRDSKTWSGSHGARATRRIGDPGTSSVSDPSASSRSEGTDEVPPASADDRVPPTQRRGRAGRG